ncbi:PaaI family thioesterase [Oceanitalea stevensii]|uniref:Hotdog fold thioesterase n=1 Tax=Oceanitalea stevensii TaxID=2763072 RepID=A0ABR8YYY9_9MICO|nr:hotdog fold thioesterase [Oceanitalea stevensii]MBD8061282.1 hotdog fold thioesterase [Oceanitalea stevensii]
MTSTDPDLLARLQDSVGSLGTLTERLGIEFLTASPEHVSARMPVEGNTQVVGLLHGGASAALAETVGSVAATLHAGAGRGAVGVDLSATHHRAVRSGFVTAVATPLHLGGRLATYDVTITDEDGRRVCTARLTCMLVDRT